MNRSTTSAAMVVTISLFLAGKLDAAPTLAERFPFDPACAWGRVSDGRGLILRCITQEEAGRLSKGNVSAQATGPSGGVAVLRPATTAALQSPAQASAAIASAPAVPSTEVGPAGTVAPTTPPIPNVPARGVDTEGTVTTPATSATLDSKDSLLAELVSVVADEGELPLAKRKLAQPIDRYAKCVTDFGGLSAVVAQVEVRFLVRERGRAEGANVAKFTGLSEAAANCIAQVIDRRPTGVPAGPVVGAAATVRVQKRPTRRSPTPK